MNDVKANDIFEKSVDKMSHVAEKIGLKLNRFGKVTLWGLGIACAVIVFGSITFVGVLIRRTFAGKKS